ncbi:MAG TPA: helix-turn-helix transcriptional regulator [Gammaproteobacteria bacterium]|nr:helix-turn-helix transcriptional regulator [Gammaproteobacteria bacterium]
MAELLDEEKSLKKKLALARGKRLTQLRSMTGLTITELAHKAGVSRAIISYWENAARNGLSKHGARVVIDTVQQEGVTCELEWLWNGQGRPPQIISHVMEDEVPYQIQHNLQQVVPSIQQEIAVFQKANMNTVIVKIDDTQLWPYFEFNDIVAGIWQPVESLHAEKFCIVTINGQLKIRWLKRVNPLHSPTLVQINVSANLTAHY